MAVRLHFIVPGHVVPSERVRKIPIRKGNGKLGVRGVTPEASAAYMAKVAHYARQAAAQCQGWRDVFARKLPVRLHIRVVRHEHRGDVDNLTKQVADGLQKAGNVYFNDNRVTQLLASVVTDKSAAEQLEVLVELAGNDDLPLWRQCAEERGWYLPPNAADSLMHLFNYRRANA